MSHLHHVRRFEVERVLALVPSPRGRLLEIGAGDGFQAKILSQHFAEACAIDVSPIRNPDGRLFPVDGYDGAHLPFPDASFDFVFSSNVLEHIAEIEMFQAEILRVLRPGGRAAHVMPSVSWRLWTLITHYIALPARLPLLAMNTHAGTADDDKNIAARPVGSRRWYDRLINVAIERRHGERGTMLGEFIRFSRMSWNRLFRRNGLRVEAVVPLGLFYTGYAVFGLRLTIVTRQKLARWLGSASILYVVAAANPASTEPERPQ